jgi:HEAT repeat protein
VIDALLSTLNHDDNVNVRLATLEALAPLAANPTVRLGLVRALPHQDSPLVQSALADVMVQLQERTSVPRLRALLRQADLDSTVKSKIEESIQTLSNGRPAAPSIPQRHDQTHISPRAERPALAV